jgi:hypothetical protein
MSFVQLKDTDPTLNLFADIRMLSDDEQGRSKGKRKANGDDDDDDDDGAERTKSIAMAEHMPGMMMLQKEPEPMRFNLRTVLRWQGKDCGIDMDYIYGFGHNVTPDERIRAEQILMEEGRLICTVCRTSIIGKHSQHVINHQNSRAHRQTLESLKSGMMAITVNALNNSNNNAAAASSGRPAKRARKTQNRGGRSIDNVRRAFSILMDDSKAKSTDLTKLKKKVAIFRITEPESLLNLSALDTEVLASFLRKVARKEFLDAMDLWNAIPSGAVSNAAGGAAAGANKRMATSSLMAGGMNVLPGGSVLPMGMGVPLSIESVGGKQSRQSVSCRVLCANYFPSSPPSFHSTYTTTHHHLMIPSI